MANHYMLITLHTSHLFQGIGRVYTWGTDFNQLPHIPKWLPQLQLTIFLNINKLLERNHYQPVLFNYKM